MAVDSIGLGQREERQYIGHPVLPGAVEIGGLAAFALEGIQLTKLGSVSYTGDMIEGDMFGGARRCDSVSLKLSGQKQFAVEIVEFKLFN